MKKRNDSVSLTLIEAANYLRNRDLFDKSEIGKAYRHFERREKWKRMNELSIADGPIDHVNEGLAIQVGAQIVAK
jgi:hypothetical protein